MLTSSAPIRISLGFCLCVLILTGPEAEGHGFEVLRGPCFPGSIRNPNPCESCVCGLFGMQYYCVKLCYYNPPIRTTTATPTQNTSQNLGSAQLRQPLNQNRINSAEATTMSPTTLGILTAETVSQVNKEGSVYLPPPMQQ